MIIVGEFDINVTAKSEEISKYLNATLLSIILKH